MQAALAGGGRRSLRFLSHALLGSALLAGAATGQANATHTLQLDHVWIAVPPGAAPERAALEQAGFRIAPTVNHHAGQGTSSLTVELENGYLELIYADDDVPVNEGGVT